MQELICAIAIFFSGMFAGFLIGMFYGSRKKEAGLPIVKNRPHIKGKHDH